MKRGKGAKAASFAKGTDGRLWSKGAAFGGERREARGEWPLAAKGIKKDDFGPISASSKVIDLN